MLSSIGDINQGLLRNPAYATVMILSRVITRLGALEEVTPFVIEELFACDLNYLQKFYRQINDLEIELTVLTESVIAKETLINVTDRA